MATASPRLQEAVARYLALAEQQTTLNTYRNTRSILNRFVIHTRINPLVSQITAEHLESFFYRGSLGSLAESSFNKAVQRVGQFFTYCQRKGWASHYLMDDIKSKEEVETEMRRYSASEMYHLYTTCKNPQERILFALACNTALRIADITALYIGAWDPRRKVVTDDPTVDLANGFLHVYIHKIRKTDAFPIVAELDEELRRWLTTYTETIDAPLTPVMRLIPSKWNAGFDSARTTKLMPYNRITTTAPIYNRVVTASGLPNGRGDGFHTLRRSFARIFYEDLKNANHPEPVRPVQAALHHATPDMTYRYIGVQVNREERNDLLQGKTLLSRLAADTTNVVKLGVARG